MSAKVTAFPGAQPKPSPKKTSPSQTVYVPRSAAALLSEQLRMFRSAYDLLVNTPVAHQRSLSNHILMRIEFEMEYLINKIAGQHVRIDMPDYRLYGDNGGKNGD